MTIDREDEDKPFLQRWSRRKRELEPAENELQLAAASQPAAPAAGDPLEESEEHQQLLQKNREEAEAIDLDSLDADSDFSPFFKDGVPKVLKSAAMRVLWRSSPVFANLDGLNDYDENFGDPALIKKFTGTAWKIGKGYLRDEVEPAEAEEIVSAAAPEVDPIEAEVPEQDDDAADRAEAGEDDVTAPAEDEPPEERVPEEVQMAGQAELVEDADAPPHKVPLRTRLALDDWETG